MATIWTKLFGSFEWLSAKMADLKTSLKGKSLLHELSKKNRAAPWEGLVCQEDDEGGL